MIIIRIKGGLGNQLFQYAVGYVLAKENSKKLLLDPFITSNMTSRKIGLNELDIDFQETATVNKLSYKVKLLKNRYVNKLIRVLYRQHNYFWKFNYFLETNETYIEKIFDLCKQDIYLDGYFQTYLYFDKYRDELIRQIRPNYILENDYIKALERIKKCNSVAVHIRHGDFKRNRNKFHYVLDEKYYSKAIEYINEQIDNPTFFVFSDDTQWAIEKLGNNFQFIHLKTTHPDIDELMLMKNCNNIITANSTFSWWAAWLNENKDPVVIVPARAYGNDFMIPNNWIKIEV